MENAALRDGVERVPTEGLVAAQEAHVSSDAPEFMEVEDGNPFLDPQEPSDADAGPSWVYNRLVLHLLPILTHTIQMPSSDAAACTAVSELPFASGHRASCCAPKLCDTRPGRYCP